MKRLRTEALDLGGLKWALGKMAMEAEAEKLELYRKGFFVLRPEGELPDLEKALGLPVPFVSVRGKLDREYWRPDWMAEALSEAKSLLYAGASLDIHRPTVRPDGMTWELHLGSWAGDSFVGWSGAWREKGRIGELFEEAIETLDLPVARVGRKYKHAEEGLVEATDIADYHVQGFLRASFRQTGSVASWMERFEELPWPESGGDCSVVALGPPLGGEDPDAMRVWNAARAVLPALLDGEHRADFELQDLFCLEKLRQTDVPLTGEVSHGHIRFEGGSNIEVRIEVDSS
ncbi:MAG: hypothetical protein AAFY88_29410, partial [Acidobacteriota bacterium]